MKKLAIVILMFFGLTSIASAELGLKVGISGQMGAFAADAVETENGAKSAKGEAAGIIGYGSIFLEKSLPGQLSRLSIGVDYVPESLSSETTEDNRLDKTTTETAAAVTNKVQLDFNDLTTFYVAFNITENLYIKGGTTSVDVVTNENLGTGSAYGNTSLDGSMYGVGYDRTTDSGMFFRVEGNVMEFDGASLTSTTNSDNSVKMSELNGVSGKISIGRAF
jgi:hypothetical protein